MVLSATLPVKPSVTTTSTSPVEDIVALDEADVVERLAAEQAVRFLHDRVALDVFLADVEQPDSRALQRR